MNPVEVVSGGDARPGVVRVAQPVATAVIGSAYGHVFAAVSDAGVVASGFVRERSVAAHGASPLLDQAVAELEEYLDGRRRRFKVPLDVGQLSAFQQAALARCAAIPYAATATYGELARSLGQAPPDGPRAVGQAMATNPMAIMVPCHRVVGAHGALVGYGGGPDTGGDLGLKRALLDHERRVAGLTLF